MVLYWSNLGSELFLVHLAMGRTSWHRPEIMWNVCYSVCSPQSSFSHSWNHLRSWVNSELSLAGIEADCLHIHIFFQAQHGDSSDHCYKHGQQHLLSQVFLNYIPWLPTGQNPIHWLDIEDEPHSPRWWNKFLCLRNGNSIICFPGHLLKITTEMGYILTGSKI